MEIKFNVHTADRNLERCRNSKSNIFSWLDMKMGSLFHFLFAKQEKLEIPDKSDTLQALHGK